jgi:hypothetical protein
VASTRGEGAYIYDEAGRRYLDGLSGLFVVQAGHGRRELAEAAARQAGELGFFPLWGFTHPKAVDLAERIAHTAPGDLNRVFFTSGGSEAVETAWKLAKQYFKLTGKPGKYKAITRTIAYHGTTHGAPALNSIPSHRIPFEPLVPGARKVPNTNFYRAPEYPHDLAEFGRWAADEIERAIEAEGPDSVAAVFLEPVQNAGGCFPPPPGYFERVRAICDRHDVLLVSDEVICAWGRLGHPFGAQRYGYQPDIITCAKGLTSGYAHSVRPSSPTGWPNRSCTAGPSFRTATPSAGTRCPARWPWRTWTSSNARASTGGCSSTRAPSGPSWRG